MSDLKEKLKCFLPEYCEITRAETVPAGDDKSIPMMPLKDIPEHVAVCVTARPVPESNIRIELWLPVSGWNGDLAGVGNGGAAGMILPMMLAGPLRLGFAAVTTDLGTSAGPDCGIDNKAVWDDFGHRATHIMTDVGKVLAAGYYGEQVRYSYFIGGSTGGQQALSEAQRYPEDYDGILACAPAYDRVNLHLAFLWDWQRLNAEGVRPFTKRQEKKLVRTLLKKCGAEGQRRNKDKFFYRPDKITVTRELLKGAGVDETQLDALMAVYKGLPGVYEGTLTPGSEGSGMGLVHRCEKDSFEKSYFYLFRWVLGSDFNFMDFDWNRDGALVHEALSSRLDAVNTDLSAYKNRGGKLLLVHGTADPIIPMTSSIRYYKDVQKTMGDTSGFFRLFLLPGMAHISGGPGVQDYVYGMPAVPKDEKHLGLLTLKAWVEDGKAPDEIYPVAFKKFPPLAAFKENGMAWERKVTPYQSDDTEG
ncbi:MAG: tannase/feruloyl esterase family alpha/beta hydrolase [Erysipelotrichaceae bacterium]|nr:tannase/feruloyl esterase family alpha/beta hydrolase [Erysipelotrichaceae bacterium]